MIPIAAITLGDWSHKWPPINLITAQLPCNWLRVETETETKNDPRERANSFDPLWNSRESSTGERPGAIIRAVSRTNRSTVAGRDNGANNLGASSPRQSDRTRGVFLRGEIFPRVSEREREREREQERRCGWEPIRGTESQSHELEPALGRHRGAGSMQRNASRTDKSQQQHLHKFRPRGYLRTTFRSFKHTS